MSRISRDFDLGFAAIFKEQVPFKEPAYLKDLRAHTPARLQWGQLDSSAQREAIQAAGISLATLMGELTDQEYAKLDSAFQCEGTAEVGFLFDRYVRRAAEPLVLAYWDANNKQRDMFARKEGL